MGGVRRVKFLMELAKFSFMNRRRKRGGNDKRNENISLRIYAVPLILRLHKLFSAVDDVADNVFPSEFDLKPGLAGEREVSHSKTFSLSIFHFPRFGFVYGNFLLHFQAEEEKKAKNARNQRGGIALSDILQ